MEQWTNIEFTNYQVSNIGNIKNRITGTVRKLSYNKGYVQFTVKINGKSVCLAVHRLVAIYYVPNPNELPEVNHKDTNTLNNHWSNLEWSTDIYNKQHAKISGVYTNNGGYRGGKKLTEGEACIIKRSALSTKQLCEIYNISRAQVKGIRSGRYWKTA
jgi:hypothetical protein